MSKILKIMKSLKKSENLKNILKKKILIYQKKMTCDR